MAKSKSSAGTPSGMFGDIIEVAININPRGRSVVHGTVLVDGHPRAFSTVLDSDQVIAVKDLALSFIAASDLSH